MEAEFSLTITNLLFLSKHEKATTLKQVDGRGIHQILF